MQRMAGKFEQIIYLSARKTILVVYGTCEALQSIMFERSCLLFNSKSLVDKFTCTSLIIVIVKENVQQSRPSCVHFFLQKCTKHMQEGA